MFVWTQSSLAQKVIKAESICNETFPFRVYLFYLNQKRKPEIENFMSVILRQRAWSLPKWKIETACVRTFVPDDVTPFLLI